MPEDEIKVSFIQRDCNYLQALEGEIDTSHFGFLHAGHVDPDELPEDEPVRNTVINRAPEYHLADTPWGTQYAGYREAAARPDLLALRQLPVSVLDPGAQRRVRQPHARARLGAARRRATPCSCFIWWKRAVSAMSLPQPAFKDGTPIGGTGRGNKLLPNTTDWLGRWRLAANPDNDWGIDRAAQSSDAIYSGIDGIHLQDQAITESMGPIVDHTLEHLAPSDQMITRTRRRLLMAARALRDNGVLAARRRGSRGLSRRAQRLLRQRRQGPLAGGLCQAAGRLRASAAEPPARGRMRSCHARPVPALAPLVAQLSAIAADLRPNDGVGSFHVQASATNSVRKS